MSGLKLVVSNESTNKLFSPSGYPLRIVLIDCPYDTIQDDETKMLFGRVFALKVRGYQKEYPYGILPIETADYVAMHLLVCEERPEGLNPVMGFKSITWDRCITHHVTFPVFDMAESSKMDTHIEAVKILIEESQKAKEKVAYNGSWTIDPDLRTNREFVKLMKELTTAMLCSYYTEYKIPLVIAAASIRFKVDAFKLQMGWKHLELRGEKLPSFFVESYHQEHAGIFTVRDWSDYSKEIAEKYKEAWTNRFVFSKDTQEAKRSVA